LALFGRGTPREAASVRNAILFVIQSDVAPAIAIVANFEGKPAMLAIVVGPETD
jgi:transposase